jgi:hypothetical protein
MNPDLSRLDRRMAIKWMLAATATVAITDRPVLGQQAAAPATKGYGTDPLLNKDYTPGDQQGDREIVLKGLAWIDLEAGKRFGKDFAQLDHAQMAAIADDICHAPDVKPELAAGAKFFAKFRDLTTSGFFTTPEGMKDLGYVGNMPLAEFKGAPPEVLAKLGLA